MQFIDARGHLMDEQTPSTPPSRRPLGKGAVILVAGVLVAALAGALLFFRGESRRTSPAPGSALEEKAPKPCLVVFPFRASAGSETVAWVGEAVQVFLTLSLEDGLGLKVLTPERVFDLSKPTGLVSGAAELETARKGGADHLLRGDVSGAPGSVRLSASWVEVSTGKEQERWTVEGIAEDSLGRKLDELAAHVRKALEVEEVGSVGPPLASLVPLKEAPTRSYLAGSALLAKGDPASALEALRDALQLEDFPLARSLEALAAAQMGDPQRAVRATLPLSKLSRPLPARVTLLGPVILALYQSGNPRNAVAPLESFLARFPDEKYPLSWLGAIELFLLNEPDEAAEVLKRARRLDPSLPDNARLLGQATLESGHAPEAAGIIEEYLKAHPEDDVTRLLLARARRGAGELDVATRLVEQVIARQPQNVSAVALMGDLLLDQGRSQDAAALYQKLAASAQPRSRAEGHALGGRVALLTGRFREGLRSLRGAVDEARRAGIPSLQGQYLILLGQTLSALGRNQEALSTFSEVRGIDADVNPELPMIGVLVMQKEFGAARGMMEAQITRWQGKLSPEAAERLRSSLEGSIALEEGKYPDAVARLQAALSERARRAPASEALGRALLKSGDAAKAADIFRRIVKDSERYEDPVGYVRSLEHLGEANEKLGKKEDAVRNYQEVLRWWGAADFSQPETEAARQALKRLGG